MCNNHTLIMLDDAVYVLLNNLNQNIEQYISK